MPPPAKPPSNDRVEIILLIAFLHAVSSPGLFSPPIRSHLFATIPFTKEISFLPSSPPRAEQIARHLSVSIPSLLPCVGTRGLLFAVLGEYLQDSGSCRAEDAT